MHIGYFRFLLFEEEKPYDLLRSMDFYGLSPYEYYMSGYFFLGESNPMETRVLRRVLRIGDIFLDVGAHIGWYSLSARQIVGPAGKVIAFEPNPSCVSELNKILF